MTNIIYEKQTINWEQKTRYKKQNDANKQWKTVNKKKATRYGYYEKGASNKHTVNWLRNQCHDHDYDIVA